MKLTTLKLGVFALGLFTFSQTATAQEKEKKQDIEKMFKKLDTNSDGTISLEEFKNKKRKKEISAEKLENMYSKIDADGNGSVTMEEYKAGLAKGKSKMKAMKKKKQKLQDSEDEN